jgi:ATP/maltotriose-dependent transcriptional regulator MalT
MQDVELPLEVEMEGLFTLAAYAHLRGDNEQTLVYAAQAQNMAQASGNQSYLAHALLLTGQVHLGLSQLVEAARAYQQALTVYDQLCNPSLAAEARSGLARIALVHGDLPGAQAQMESILNVLAAHPYVGLDEPFQIYLTSFRVLEASGDERAASILQAARRLLQEYADHIADPALRRLFLENVATHRAILEAAATAHTLAPQLS